MQKMHDMTGNETENCKCWHKKHKQIFFVHALTLPYLTESQA